VTGFIFVPMLVLLGLVGFAVFVFAARCFVVVVQDTAAGLDEVVWPDEPVLDWLTRAVQVLGLFALCLAPAGILWRALRPGPILDSEVITFLLIAAPLLWLAYPVVVLSSFSGESPWMVLRWAVFRFLLRRPGQTLLFYFSSGVLFVVCLGLLLLTLWSGSFLLTPVAGVVCGASLLIYARLLGRMGWLFGRFRPLKRHRQRPSEPPGSSRRAERRRPVRKRRKKRPAAKTDEPIKVAGLDELAEPPPPTEPQAAAEAEPDLWAEAGREVEKPAAAYHLTGEEPPPLPTEVPLDGSLPFGSRGMLGADPAARRPGAEREPRPGLKVPDYEMRLLARHEELPPPPVPLGSGVWNFPLYPPCHKAWFLLSLGGFGMLAILLLLIALAP